MPADIHTGSPSTSQSGERARARACSELRLLDLDDLCLSEILVRAVPPQLPWEFAGCGSIVSNVRRIKESSVYCGRVLRVCRRFRDALLSRATGRLVCNSNALLRFAPRLRRLEIASDSQQLPWRVERSGDSLSIVPPALAHLTNVTQIEMRDQSQLDAGWVQHVITLPLLRDLELCGVQVEKGPELQGLAALTALTHLQLPDLVAKSAAPDSLECFSRLQALQTFGALEAEFASASILRFVAALTALSALHLRGVFVYQSCGQLRSSAEHDALLEIASEARGLKELRYPFEYITSDGFSCISRLTQLTVLDLTGSLQRLSERDLRRIVALPRLRQLVLMGDGCERVPPLNKLTALESLYLEVDEPSGGQRMAGLSALTHLRLRLRGWTRLALGQPAIEALATLSSLRELSLFMFCFDSAAGAAVGALRGMRRLSLLGCNVAHGSLGGLTQLHELTLREGDTEAGILTELALLTGLRALEAGWLSQRSSDCADISTLTQLTRLELSLQDSIPGGLPRLTLLQDLTVSVRSEIGQQGFDSMAALCLLTNLSVSSRFSCMGTVSRLTALQRLVTLRLYFPSSTTSEDLAALAGALPELRQLRATCVDKPLRDSEVLARLAHLRGTLHDPGPGNFPWIVGLGSGPWLPTRHARSI